jgi:hypothetical protein
MKKSLALSALALIISSGVAGANLINNPGFEDPICMTWSVPNETTNFFGWGNAEANNWQPHSGSQSLALKNWLGATDGAEQKPTVLASTIYSFSFWHMWDSGYNGTPDFQVRWIDNGGTQIGSNSISFAMGSASTWYQQSVAVTSMVGSTRAEINFNNFGNTSGALYIDDVDFDVAAVPEPATVTLLGLAGVCMWMIRRRKK